MVKRTGIFAALLLTLTPTLAKAEVRGLYGTNCLEGEGVSAIKDLLLRELTLETVHTLYSDSKCEEPAYDFSFSGPYDLDQETGFLNYAYQSIKLQVLSVSVAQRFNETSLCGINDWAVNAPREVSGLICGDQLIPSAGTSAYDLIKSSAKNNSIQLGLITDDKDGLSSEGRPILTEDISYYPK